jgi:hypothetical protein
VARATRGDRAAEIGAIVAAAAARAAVLSDAAERVALAD